ELLELRSERTFLFLLSPRPSTSDRLPMRHRHLRETLPFGKLKSQPRALSPPVNSGPVPDDSKHDGCCLPRSANRPIERCKSVCHDRFWAREQASGTLTGPPHRLATATNEIWTNYFKVKS